jgi:putative transport protein
MTTAIEWIRVALRSHSEVALFLAVSVGFFVGKLRIRNFQLGPVAGCLLAGVAVGQLDIKTPDALNNAFFLLFLFSVGYKAGPQFFRGLRGGALPQVILSVLFCVAELLLAYVAVRLLGRDAGTAAGLIGGSTGAAETVGTASGAIGKLAIAEDVRHALTENLSISFAVTYLVGIFATIAVLVRVGPWILRVDLRTACEELEHELGMKKETPGVVSAYKQFAMRAYKLPAGIQIATVAELESAFSPGRVFVEKVRNKEGIFDGHPGLKLAAGDCVVISGRHKVLGVSSNPLQCHEIDEPELLDVPAIEVDHVLQRKDLQHRTLAEIVAILEKEAPTRGVFLRKVLRAGEELPIGEGLVLERGDVLTMIGAQQHVNRVAELLGPVQRASNATDIGPLCLVIVIGGLIGLPALHLGNIHLGLGVPVGVLLAALFFGWLQSLPHGFVRMPESVLWLLDSLGLTAFVASIGMDAGHGFFQGVSTSGLSLLVLGLVLCAVPYIFIILVGRYLFRLHPGILLGICAGSGTTSPGLAALIEKAESRVPVIGYSVSYAISQVLFALWGSLIVTLVHKS